MYSLSLQLNKKTALIYILIRKEFTHSLKDWWTYRQSYLSSLETLLVRITGTLLQIYKFGIYKWPPTAITADQDNLGRCSEQASLRYATLACELFWAEGNGDLACSRETILFYFFILEGGEKERGRETGTDVRETYQLAVFCIHPCNPGMCPDRESNRQSLSLWDDTNQATPARPKRNFPFSLKEFKLDVFP